MITRPVILYRGQDFERHELAAATHAGFFCTKSRVNTRSGDIVLARYSALPYYKELEHDLSLIGATLVNSFRQHNYVADLMEWYQDLSYCTPQTWRTVTDIPLSESGPFVLKGATNSKKFNWDTHMFCSDRSQLGQVLGRLQDDSLIGSQDIYIRKYVPLRHLADAPHGLPISKEFRFFVHDGEVIGSGFYWSSHIDDLTGIVPGYDLDPNMVPKLFIGDVIQSISDKVSSVVIDVAETASGDWCVIELNDAQQSGLSEVEPLGLYKKWFDKINI